MNALEKFLKEQKQVEMYGQYQDMVQEDWIIARELERLQKENEELIEKGVKKLHKISELRKENDKLKKELVDIKSKKAQVTKERRIFEIAYKSVMKQKL